MISNMVGNLLNNPLVVQTLEQSKSYLEKYEKWQLVLMSISGTFVGMKLYYFYIDIDTGLVKYVKSNAFKFAKNFSFLNSKLDQELNKVKKSLNDEIFHSNMGNPYIQRLPDKGKSNEEILQMIQTYVKMVVLPYKSGALSGCVYGASDTITELTTRVFEKYAWSNPMHADVFPDIRKMEAEVVRWVLNLFNGDQNSCGTMTSGGTESIMLACKVYRDIAYSKGIKRPEMVVPITAHAAFDKAAHFFRIRIHHVPIDPHTKRVNTKLLTSYINSNTCMIVGSAPPFAHGAIDPIEDLSKIALRYEVPLHVDACLGGFLIPFMKEAGFELPLFDFRLKGVTSISCDTHKYGYTPKGSSVIMYRNTEYRRYQYFAQPEWPGGIYVSPTMAGSRAGSLIAMTWATLMSFGYEGYVEATRKVIEATKFIANGVRQIKEIQLMCEPDVSVVSFDSKDFNVLKIIDEMVAKGWLLNAIQNPVGIHIAVTYMHTQAGVKEKFIDDLKAAVKEIMTQDDRQLGKKAQIYCSSQTVPDTSIISDITYLFLDACYNTKESTENQNGSPKANGKH